MTRFSRSSLWLALALGSLSFSATPTLAQQKDSDGLDAASVEALDKTKALLRDPSKRQEALKNDPNAAKADSKARETAGSAENTQAMYNLSADIMDTITKEAKGDPVKMQEMLQKAMVDPEGFYKKLTPEQRARIKDIADKSPAGQAQKAGKP